MGLVFAWVMIALAVPVFPAADGAPGIVWLIVAGAAATYLEQWLPRPSARQLELAIWSATLIGIAVGLFWAPIMATRQPPAATNSAWVVGPLVILVFAALAMAAPVRAYLSSLMANVVVSSAVLAVMAAGGAYIVGVPDPRIDVFSFLNEGARGLLAGQNPYAMTFSDGGAVYSYLPGMLLVSLPTVALFGDVRWLMLGSLPVSAFFLRQTLRRCGARGRLADLCTLAFVSYPGWLWVIREAWPEPLIVCAFLIAAWGVTSRQLNWAIAAAALFLSVKQYAPLLLLGLWPAGLSLRRGLLAAALALGVCLPFVVWSPGDFWWDAVYFQVQAPARADAVSLNGFLMSTAGTTLPGVLSLAAPLAASAHAAWCAYRGGDVRTMLRLTAASYFVLFLFNKFAFANYYFLLQVILILAAGLTLTRRAQVELGVISMTGSAPPAATAVSISP